MTAPTTADGAATPFRWRLAQRPDLRFGHAAGGVAGVLVAAAVLAFIVAATGDDPTLPGVGFSVALVAAALAAGWKVRGPVRSAAVGALVLAVPMVWLFAVVGDGSGFGRSDIRLIFLLSVVSYLALYLLPWTRGRAVLLGLALFVAAGWIVYEIAAPDQSLGSGVAQSIPILGSGSGSGSGLGSDDATTETAIAQVVIAIVLLGAGVVLDRRGRAGAATPCLLVGGLYAITGALTVGADVGDVYATGAGVVVAGLAIGLAGSAGRRRGTSWLAAAVLLAGALTVIVNGTVDTATTSDATAVRFGLFALLGAAALLAVGILVARQLGEPIDGGEPRPVPALVPAVPAAETTADAATETAEATPPPPPPTVTWSAKTPEPDTPEPDTPEPDTPEPDTPEQG